MSSTPHDSRPPDSLPPDSRERRAYTRYAIWFPITLVTAAGAREVWAICQDACSKGLLVSCMAPLEVGEGVSVKFRVTREAAERETTARVLRCTLNADELKLAFPYRLAIEFDHAETNLEERLRQAALASGAT
jgi:hypothetical protein